MRPAATSAVTLLVAATLGCGAVRSITVPALPPSPEQLAALWVDPGSAPRDLYWGIGGPQHAPSREVDYTLEEEDDSGFSVSYDVESPDGLEWSAKIGPEAQTEVVVSRILWGLGYHQPPIYYLPSWRLVTDHGTKTASEARFRPKLPSLRHLDEYWHWAENPFLGAREFRGLLVVLLMLNSTDLKDDNNAIYEAREPWDSGRRWFLVRDLGASLGETGKLYPRRNWLTGFEEEPFITGVSAAGIDFGYRGRHRELLSLIAPDDVRWAAQRLARLTERQWRDAFRAGNYSDEDAARYVARIREKIEDALALRVDHRADD